MNEDFERIFRPKLDALIVAFDISSPKHINEMRSTLNTIWENRELLYLRMSLFLVGDLNSK